VKSTYTLPTIGLIGSAAFGEPTAMVVDPTPVHRY